MPASSAADQMLVNLRVASGSPSEVVANGILSAPNDCASTAAAAELKVLWPETYAGNGGVSSSGVHFDSGSASRIAVMGRQNSNVNLITQHRMPASARAMFRCANSLAFSTSVLPRSSAIVWAILFQCP